MGIRRIIFGQIKEDVPCLELSDLKRATFDYNLYCPAPRIILITDQPATVDYKIYSY